MPSEHPVLRDDDLLVRPTAADDGTDADELVVRFVVEWRDEVVGLLSLIGHDADDDLEDGAAPVGVLMWDIDQPPSGPPLAVRTLRLVLDFALAEPGPGLAQPGPGLGLRRVEARVPADDGGAVRAALRAGMRREGLLRGAAATGGATRDLVVLGRLRDDPAPDTRDGFTAMLNSTLPTKRAIAQGLIRNATGEVLLCELTYKRDWDLPGGVVDVGESPAACVVREIREELDLQVRVRGLLAVNWLPPLHGWGDAVGLVFELGTLEARALERVTLEPREIRALHWVGPDEWAERVAPYNVRLLTTLQEARQASDSGPLYLEDGTAWWSRP